VSEASTGKVAAVAVRKVETFTGSPEARRVRTQRSRSCSSAETFPFRREADLFAERTSGAPGPDFRTWEYDEQPASVKGMGFNPNIKSAEPL
jgi:hypothetical protein